MNWSTINLYIGISNGESVTPLTGVNVNFILLNESTTIQYQTTVESDSNGNLVLANNEDAIYIKTNYNPLAYNGGIETSIVDNTDDEFDSVVKWYATYESDSWTTQSEIFYLTGINTDASLIVQNDRGSQQQTTPSNILLATFFYDNGHTVYAVPSEYGIYFYTDNDVIVGVETGVTSSELSFIGKALISLSPYPTATKLKASAYSDYNNLRKWYVNDGFTVIANLPILNNTYSFGTELVTQTSVEFYITKLSVLDMTQKLFGLNYGVSNFGLKVKSYYGNILYNNTFSVSSIPSTISLSLTGNSTNPAIPKIKLIAEPVGMTNISKYYSGFTDVNLHTCQYYNIHSFKVESDVSLPNKSLEVENPIILDSISTNLSTPAYNLPNVDMTFKFKLKSSQDVLSTTTGSSTYSSTTLNVPQTVDVAASDYLKTVVGQDVSTYTLDLTLSKHHYNDKNVNQLFISALTYVDGVETRPAKLYFCKKYNQTPLAGPYFQNIDREQYVCFRRVDFSEYVQGFDFVYGGNVIQSGNIYSSISITLRDQTRDTYPGVSAFNLSEPNKIIVANRDFYSACSYNTYPKLEDFTTMNDYIDGFVDAAISRPEIITRYTEGNRYNTDYNLNGHAYTNGNSQIKTFEPVATNAYNYLEFTTKNENATIVLTKTGSISPITTIQYSYWGFAWRPYTIGSEIVIVPGSNVRFRNSSNSTSFSNNTSDYYYFDIDGNNVTVKGNISSLINVSANGQTVTGSFSFYNLFKDTPILNANDLVLDPIKISYGCYLQMFQNCTNLVYGPSLLKAKTGSTSCLQKMFSGCTKMETCFTAISLTTIPNYCCDKTFEGCSKLKYAPIFTNYSSHTSIGIGAFGQMFKNCTGLEGSKSNENWYIGQTGCTYGTNSCYEMFAGCSGLTATPFMNPLVIESEACYATFSGCSNLTVHNFTLTDSNGTVGPGGCSYMFYKCENLDNLTSTRLNFTDLYEKCYYHMFDGCSRLSCVPKIESSIIPSSGCAYMYADCFQYKTSRELSQFVTTGLTSIAPFGMAYMFKNCKYLDFRPVIQRNLLYNGVEAEFATYNLYDLTEVENPAWTNDWGPQLSDVDHSVAFGYDYDENGVKRYHVKYFTYQVTGSSTLQRSGYAGYFYEYGPYFKDHNNQLISGYDFEYEYQWRYINATKLSESCCEYMFSDCTSLHYGNHIILNANHLVKNCYGHMFQGCSELVSTPIFFSGITSYAASACQFMFAFCSSSKGNNARMKPQKNSNGNIIRESYMNWIDPDVTSSYTKSYYTHNKGLRSFQKLYNYRFNAFGAYEKFNTSDPDYSYIDFSATSENLRSISNNITYVGSDALLNFSTAETQNACFSHMFYGCYGLVSAYANIKTKKAAESAFEHMFAGCHSLSGGLTYGTSLVASDTAMTNSFRYMFQDCFELRNSCVGNSNILKPLTVQEQAYRGLYKNCFKLITGPEVDAQTVGTYGCCQMFYNCLRLNNIKNNALPATNLSTACYSHMFYGCSSLKIAPELMSQSVPVSGYNYMFADCNLWYFTGQTNYKFWSTLSAASSHGSFITYAGTAPFEIYNSYFSYFPRFTHNIHLNDKFKLDFCGNRFYSIIDRRSNGANDDVIFKLQYVGGSVPNELSPYSSLTDNYYYVFENNLPYSLNDIISLIYNSIEDAVGSGTSRMVSKNYWCRYYHLVNNKKKFLYVYNKSFTLPSNPENPTGQSVHFATGKNDIDTDTGDETFGYPELRGRTVEKYFDLKDTSNNLLMEDIPVELPILIDETQLDTLCTNVATYMRNYYYNHGGTGTHSFPSSYNVKSYYDEYKIRCRYVVTSGGNKTFTTGYSLNYNGNDVFVTPGEIRLGRDLNDDLESPNFYIPINDKTKWNCGLSQIKISATALGATVSSGWTNMLNLKNGVLKAPNLVSYPSNSINGLPENWTKTN